MNRDLRMVQGISPISVAKEIEAQQTIEGLVAASGNVNRIVERQLNNGAKAYDITRSITEINDRLVIRILLIAERTFGRPPVPYCWIVMGSEGRMEQTFKTDQDNAMIYSDAGTETEEPLVKKYFEDFSIFTRDALVKCGFPVCPGDYMASNPLWRQPLSVWKEYFTKWIKTPTTNAVLFSSILFDFRPMHGDVTLAETLRRYLTKLASSEDMFLKHMADMSVRLRTPLGIFRTFVVEKSGEHKNELNLKFKCIAPMVNIARLFSLEKGVTDVSTLDRIHALKEKHPIFHEFGEELEHAFEFLSLLRIRHQFDQIEAGKAPDNFINPSRLNNVERRTFKGVCQLISRVQDAIAKQYNPGTIL
jgi:CBS domain-containing protein